MENSSKLKKFIRTLFSRKIVIGAFAVVVIFILMAVLAPVLAPYDPNYADFAAPLAQPDAVHMLGTDSYGRDVLSRIIFGTRVSLIIGVLAVCIACDRYFFRNGSRLFRGNR